MIFVIFFVSLDQDMGKFTLRIILFCLCIPLYILGDIQSMYAKEAEESILQKTINTYIIEVYKLQWKQILEELDTNLEKIAPTHAAKIDAYSSIQETLILRREATMKDSTLGKNVRSVIVDYLNYMITAIDQKKSRLQ